MKAQDIINKCRTELKDFIVYEAKALFKKLNLQEWYDEEDMEEVSAIIGDVDLECAIPISVECTDVEGNYFKEDRQVEKIIVYADDDLAIQTDKGEINYFDQYEPEPIEWTELSTDELYQIAYALETTYLKK